MLNQKYDDRSREQINRLEDQLAKTLAEMEILQTKHDLLWQQIFSAFDHAEGEGVSSSFICDDGYKLMRIVPNMQPVIDNKKMEQVALNFGTAEMGKRLWNRITDVVRVVNQDKLAKEFKRVPEFEISANMAEAIKTPSRKPSRKREEANKEERMWLEHELKKQKAV